MLQNNTANNKRIAKNTVFLYFRMMLTMFISVFTSRIILQKLGVEDYGIYQTVGGLVAMISNLQSSLSVGSSRFLTYELGRKNGNKLNETFSSILTVHIIIAIIIVLIAEIVGPWMINNKLTIPPDRLYAANVAFQFSVITIFFNITQVPYRASIISHEKMNIYAYISVIEVTLNLIVVYLLSMVGFDKLIVYSLLLCIVRVGLTLFYRFYCICKFEETKYKILIKKDIIKKVLSFSGWNFFASMALMLSNQGVVLLTNMFFIPAVVAARGLANQINGAIINFVGNFRTAVNPQIVKRLAANDVAGSHTLLLSSAKYSFFLMLLLSLPVWIVSDELLHIWLEEVPQYTLVFLKIVLITGLINSLDQSFFVSLYALGRIKENSLTTASLFLSAVISTYILFECGASPIMSAVTLLIAQILIVFIAKPLLMSKYALYDIKDIYTLIGNCMFVLLLVLPLPFLFSFLIDKTNWSTGLLFFSKILSTLIPTCIIICVIGLNKEEKTFIKKIIRNRIRR